tara:strand:- start:385 stop:711 length:327 start_codon:yes stop_codon:yes gene_type:complete
MKITAIPLTPKKQSFEIKTSDLIKVYYGSLDQCRCGCGGDYYYPDSLPPHGLEQANIKDALRRLEMSAMPASFIIFDSEVYFELCLGHEFDEEAEEDKRIGYGFYFKK